MGAVENNVAVLPVQPPLASAADEPRVLCIVYNMVSDENRRPVFNINLPMSVSCQTLINDIRSTIDDLPAEFDVIYKRNSGGESTDSVKINDYAEKSIGEICLHCGDRGKNSFYIYHCDSSGSQSDNLESIKPKTSRSNAICEATVQSSVLALPPPSEESYSNKDNYGACSASASSSSGIYSFSLSTLPKSDTGYVGLVNQAMTCYLNSLLQSLFMTPEFRNAVYRWMYDGSDSDATHSIPYQLQRLFLQLQTSNKRAVETTDITRSFGWDSSEAWHQHDIQELCRVMFDALERTWKSTDQENLINELYQGKIKDYVRCLKCGSVNARPDTFLDLPLVIRPYGAEVGYGSVEQALKAFEEYEILEGSNQYFCEKCAMHCDAHKGLRIVSFPYILTLHLKRFGFDHCTYQRVKLNDRMTFPELLVLERSSDERETSMTNKEKGSKEEDPEPTEDHESVDMRHGDGEDAVEDEGIDIGDGSFSHTTRKLASDTTEAQQMSEMEPSQKQVTTYQYQLFAIMVHSGSAAGGHYYAYIRSFKDGQWYSFNDQHVFKINEEDIKRTYGGNTSSTSSYSTYSSSTNAYMLQYRLIDPARNKDFMEEDNFPVYLKDELMNIRRREEEEIQLQELDRNTCKIKCFLYNESLEKYTEQKLEVHKSKTLAEATEIAWKLLEMTNLPLDCVRLVKFDSIHEYIEQSFDEEEEKSIGSVLGGVKSSYHFDLLLETKQPDAEFVSHFRNGLMVRLYIVDVENEVIDSPKTVRVLPNETVFDFKRLICSTCDLSFDTVTLVLDKGFSNFCPLLLPDKTLSQEGFERVNRVFVDYRGTEQSENYQPGTDFFQLLSRFANTISITISLPSMNEITHLQSSLLRSYFLNRPTQDTDVESLTDRGHAVGSDKAADVDEGIGESETDIHCHSCAGAEASSDVDLITGVGAMNMEALSRTSDWSSSICSTEMSHDTDKQCTDVRVTESELELNSSGATTEVQSEEFNSSQCTSEEPSETDVISDKSCAFPPHGSAKPPNKIIGINEVENIADVDLDIPIGMGSEFAESSSILPSSQVPSFRTDVNFDDDNQMLNLSGAGEISEMVLEPEVLEELEPLQTAESDDFHGIPTPQTSPRVSSDGSNSPELIKELTCPKESEENWDLDESPMMTQGANFVYFKVDREINGLFERSMSVQVDRRMIVGRLKSHLEPYMGTSAENFRVFRVSTTGPDLEMNKVYESLHSLSSGTKLSIKLGRALKPGEYKLSVYELQINKDEPIKFLLEVIVAKGISLQNLKRLIIGELQYQLGMQVPVDRCRLRRKCWKNPSGIFTTDAMLEELFRDSTNIELFLEVIEKGPDRMETEGVMLLQIYVRRWRPSVYQLDPVQELIVSDWTLSNIRSEISQLSGIAQEDVCVSKARGQFPCNIPALEVEREMQWNPPITEISVFPMAVADDGAVLFYKDATELLAELTEEQKKEVQEKENARLQKLKPAIKVPSQTERALKIYTVSDQQHENRASS